MLVQVLIGGGVLVVQDDNAALSFAVDPVSITTLHVVCDTVRVVMSVATDKWSTVALLTEKLENAEHHSPPSHN
jgi:hypothetical protein